MNTPRLDGAELEQLSDRERHVLEQQERKWGKPLANHLIYARCPEIFHGAQGMWRGLGSSGRLESSLAAILNRRVAILNRCEF